MVRTWNSTLVLLLGGAACVAIGVVMGSRWGGARSAPKTEVLWRAAPPAAVALPSTNAAAVPSFRNAVDRVGPAVVTVRARLPIEPPPAAATPAAATAGATDSGPATAGPPLPGPSVAEGAAGRSEPPRHLAAAAEPRGGWRNGTGFLVNTGGLILTSRHVVAGAASIEVMVPHHGRKRADLVGEDRATDLALLRLVDPPPQLPELVLGGSDDLRAGDWIVTVGNPFGFARTVTAGVVSFVGRHLPHSDFGVTSDFLQISAPINPGSSGCPVVDAQGRVVGVTTQVAVAAQGISFAVPSRSVKWALDAMSRQPDGRVRRGYLGIEFASRLGFDDAGEPWPGAVIVSVAAGEPADRAGLRAGDVVLRVDGAPVHDARDLHERIVRSDPGTSLALQLLRDGRVRQPIVAVLGQVGGAEGEDS